MNKLVSLNVTLLLRTAATRCATRRAPRDAGMSTAEYAIGTVAAAALAAVLFQVVTSDTVSGALTGLVERAFDAPL
ncbi:MULTISPECIES: DUF4244 domain-containing protein [Streptomyces]|uniref:DUF4244 domain-containing protein n=1 Tax=Streptomyces TaxID=1883 RepID=UPI000CD5340A|nr:MULTISPECIES: DUF4244 domain-containing protein [Streptomyces]